MYRWYWLLCLTTGFTLAEAASTARAEFITADNIRTNQTFRAGTFSSIGPRLIGATPLDQMPAQRFTARLNGTVNTLTTRLQRFDVPNGPVEVGVFTADPTGTRPDQFIGSVQVPAAQTAPNNATDFDTLVTLDLASAGIKIRNGENYYLVYRAADLANNTSLPPYSTSHIRPGRTALGQQALVSGNGGVTYQAISQPNEIAVRLSVIPDFTETQTFTPFVDKQGLFNSTTRVFDLTDGDAVLTAQNTSTPTAGPRIGALEFDLESLPDDALLGGATLTLRTRAFSTTSADVGSVPRVGVFVGSFGTATTLTSELPTAGFFDPINSVGTVSVDLDPQLLQDVLDNGELLGLAILGDFDGDLFAFDALESGDPGISLSLTYATVPEPASMLLLSLGLGGLICRRRR